MNAAPPVGGDGLPPRPKPECLGVHFSGGETVYGYTADQYIQGQREAYEAGRRAAVPAQTGTQPAGDSVDTPEFRLLLAECLTVTEAPFDLRQRIKAELARRAAVSTASASEHADWCIGGAKGPCNCRAPSSPVE